MAGILLLFFQGQTISFREGNQLVVNEGCAELLGRLLKFLTIPHRVGTGRIWFQHIDRSWNGWRCGMAGMAVKSNSWCDIFGVLDPQTSLESLNLNNRLPQDIFPIKWGSPNLDSAVRTLKILENPLLQDRKI